MHDVFQHRVLTSWQEQETRELADRLREDGEREAEAMLHAAEEKKSRLLRNTAVEAARIHSKAEAEAVPCHSHL